MTIKSKAKTKQSKQTESVITAFKGFDKNFQCRGMQFEVGNTYHTDKHPIRCGNTGFHACDNPFDVLYYYPMNGQNRFARVEAAGEICRKEANDTKFATATLTIQAELQMSAFFKACVDYIWNIVDPSKIKITHQSDAIISKKKDDKIGTSGYGTQIGTSGKWTKIGTSGYGTQIGTSGKWTQIGTSGDGTQIGTSGKWTKIGTSGYGTQIGTSGDGTQIGTSGKWTKIGTSGDGTQIGTSGDGTQIGTSGKWTKIGTSGDGTQIGTSGYGTQIGTSGYGTQIGTSGDGTQIGTSGKWTKIGTSGYGTKIELNGEHGVLACVHAASKIKASLGTLVCLVHFADDNKTPLKFVTGKIGEAGLKPETWYMLDKDGNFAEAA